MSASTWRSDVAPSQALAADGRFDARTPWWHSSTVDQCQASRPHAAHEPLDVPHTARRPIGEDHGDDARCMDCGTLISFGYCGCDDCPELACPVCLIGSSRLIDA